ncbi:MULTISPECIES: PilW family protein [Marinobacter]|uniref:PilW family protein n=1 Tax=Marinobacter TaxID=2742 RepID=UPI0012472E20|nr:MULTISPECIES: PilW family protein [Marinobacter]MBL3558250.1 PilW family protein [Marinobacter sp. JB05H06]
MSKSSSFFSCDAGRQSNQSGLSMVELLIATALGLLLTLGVTQIYLSGNETYRQTQGLAHAQESTRFVSAVLSPDLRTAGSFGCIAEMGMSLDQVVDNRLNGGLIVPLTQALQGWEYTGTGPGDSVTLASALATPGAGNWASGTAGANLPAELVGSVITNSDVIIVNAMTPLGVPVDAANPQNGNSINLAGNSGVGANRIILATLGDCSEGELFQKSNNTNSSSITMAGNNVTPGNNGNNFNLAYEPQSRAYEFTSMAFYIGQGTNGEPALFRRLMIPLQPPQELVSGVETLQILYGENSAGTNAADDYLPADEVTDWEDIVSVRFSVMTRSPDEVLENENTRSFDMLGSEVTQANGGDRRVRLISVGTTALRARM